MSVEQLKRASNLGVAQANSCDPISRGIGVDIIHGTPTTHHC